MTNSELERLRAIELLVKEQDKKLKLLNDMVWKLTNNPVRRLSKVMRTQMLKTIAATVDERVMAAMEKLKESK